MEEVTSKRRREDVQGAKEAALPGGRACQAPGIFQRKCLGQEHAGRSCGKEVSG